MGLLRPNGEEPKLTPSGRHMLIDVNEAHVKWGHFVGVFTTYTAAWVTIGAIVVTQIIQPAIASGQDKTSAELAAHKKEVDGGLAEIRRALEDNKKAAEQAQAKADAAANAANQAAVVGDYTAQLVRELVAHQRGGYVPPPPARKTDGGHP